MELPVPESFTILERLSGHVPQMGKSAGQELNWAYRLKDQQTQEECIGMFCKPNHLTLIDVSIWEQLKGEKYKDITWYYTQVGYISRTQKVGDTIPYVYLHQLILEHSKNGKGQESVDHINQNKLDNRKLNLRIVSQAVQNINRKKVSRHENARQLPPELTDPLPKFCVYYKECYNKEKNLWREFFTIEGHPNQKGQRKATTKSGKVSIQNKLKEALQILSSLDNPS
jgi:hypothetical protein